MTTKIDHSTDFPMRAQTGATPDWNHVKKLRRDCMTLANHVVSLKQRLAATTAQQKQAVHELLNAIEPITIDPDQARLNLHE